MSHYTVLIASPFKDEKFFYRLMDENNWGDVDSPEPWGFDYLCPLDEEKRSVVGINQAHLFHKSKLNDGVNEIIDSNGKELWYCDGIYTDPPPCSYEEALALIPEDHWCCLFDGHL